MLAIGSLSQVSPAVAQSSPAPVWAYVFGHDFTADVSEYTPVDSYQFNSTDATNTITRTGTGAYTLNLPGMDQLKGNVQVTAITETGAKCVAGQGTGFLVNCYDATGAAVDTNFFMLYFQGNVPVGYGEITSAFVWNNDPDSDTYTPDERYQFNSTGEGNTIASQGVGSYLVSLPGMGAESGTFQVTATNSGAGVTCSILKWSVEADNLKTAVVGCYDSIGAPIDSGFTLLYLDGKTPSTHYVNSDPTGAYLTANQPDANVNAPYSTGKDWQYNSSGGDNTVTRTGTGTYKASFPGVGAEAGTIQVTAYGAGDVSCNSPRWSLDGDTFVVEVSCFDTAGKPVNATFMLVYVSDIWSDYS